MSWAAHELETYVLQKHLKTRASYVAMLFGVLLPDLFTKLPVYGINVGKSSFLKAGTPFRYHRGWPGVGFTHTLFFSAVVALLVLRITRQRAWFIGVLLGGWSHVFTDVFDSAGTMVFFPFSTQHYSAGMWGYAAQAGRYGDAAAYYSSLGGVWDFFWLCMVVFTARTVLRADYFVDVVVPNDPFWPWVRRRFALSPRVMLALYRSFFVYGSSRIFGWFLWSRVFNPQRGTQVLDWTWRGPHWISAVSFPWPGFAVFAENTARGAIALTAFFVVVWWLLGRHLWSNAGVAAAGLVHEASS